MNGKQIKLLKPGARARTSDQKEIRRQAILHAACELFKEKGYQPLTVADVAKRAGLSKGTIYVYFQTKEDMFLHILESNLAKMLDYLTNLFDYSIPAGPGEIAKGICLSLQRDSVTLPLFAHMTVVLEQNASYQAVSRFKHFLIGQFHVMGDLLAKSLPKLSRKDTVRLCIRISAAILGCYQLCHQSPTVVEVVSKEPGLSELEMNFDEELEAVLTAILGVYL